jgi:capsular exopolysaccharide synthesis family protein
MMTADSVDAPSLDYAVRQVIRALRSHKRLFAYCFCAVLLPGLVLLELIPPRYIATATVAITAPAPGPLLSGMAPAADPAQDEDWPLTVSSLMQSRDVAAAAIQAVPPAASRPGLVCRVSFGLLCRALSPALQREAQIEALQKSLIVTPEPHSQVIDVVVADSNPDRAAALANAVVGNYQRIALDQETANAAHLAAWLTNQSDTLRQSWVAAQEQADDFAASHGLTMTQTATGTAPLVEQQIGAVAANLAAAQAQMDGTSGDTSASAVSSQPVLVAASNTLMALQNERDQLSAEFGPNYPKIQALDREIESTQSTLSRQTRSYSGSTRGGLAAAKRQVQELSAQLDALRAQAAREAPEDSEYTTLNTRADSLRTAYQAFQQQADEVMDRPALLQPPVTSVSPAEPPLLPAFPNKPKFAIGLIFIGFVAGTVAMLVKDRASPGFGQAEDLRSSLQLPLLATLPILPEAAGAIESYVFDQPYSRTSEAVRGIAATLALLAGEESGPRSVLITSAGALEGKSTLATWLAMAVRHTGQRVLLIDGDHRRGTLMQDAAAKDRLGLTDVLAGKASLDEVVQIDEKSGIAFIAAGTATARSFGGVDVARLRGLMNTLKKTYSLIVIDSPPLLAMVDGLVLGTVADQTVFVCRWKHSSRQAVMASLERMRRFGTNVAGVVVSMVEPEATLDFIGDYSRREGRLISQLYGS